MVSKPDHSELRLIPQKIRDEYTGFRLSSETSYYKVYQAKSNLDGLVYSIRVLNVDSDTSKKDPDAAATLFLREIIYLCLRLSKIEDIKLDHFVISEGKIGFVLPQYFSIDQTLTEETRLNLNSLLQDIKADLHFLTSRLQLSKQDIELKDIYKINEEYVLGDWSNSSSVSKEESQKSSTDAKLNSLLKKLEQSGQTVQKSAWQQQTSSSTKVAWCSLISAQLSVYDSENDAMSYINGANLEEGKSILCLNSSNLI